MEYDDYSEEDLVVHKKGIKTVTYYSDLIMWVIQESIRNAKKYIKANMSYLSNEDIFDALICTAKEGIDIELIIGNNDTNNKNFHLYNSLLDSGVKIFQQGDDDWREGIMHRKSVVIDRELLLSGSYNWTNQAEKNTEELFVIEDIETIDKVLQDFSDLKQKSNQLFFREPLLGSYIKCSKSNETEIENWWRHSLDENWRNFFQEKFKLNNEPSLAELIQLTNCEYLVVNFNDKIDSIEPLCIFTKLNHLVIYNCPNVSDLNPIRNLINLKNLDIAVTGISDLSPLSNMSNLKELNISNTKVSNLDPINNIGLDRIIIYNLKLSDFFGPRPDFFRLNPNCKINFA